MKKTIVVLLSFIIILQAQAQWIEKNNGLYGGNVTVLAASGDGLFAGTFGGGVFRSTNNGISWTSSNTGLTNLNIQSFAVVGVNVFVGTVGGIFRSTDNGANWSASNSGLTNTKVESLTVSGGNLFAGTRGGGVFRSTDNGANWSASNSGLTNTKVESLTVSGSNLFAGTSGGGFFLSTDNGESWTLTSTISTSSGPDFTFFTFLVASGNTLFAGVNGKVFRSTDNGVSFVSTGLENIQALVVNGSTVIADGFQSTDNGINWTAIPGGGIGANSFVVSGSDLLAGTSSGIFRSTNNGESWTDSNSGLANVNAGSLASSGSNLFVGTYGNGVFRSTDNGASWTFTNTGVTNTGIQSLLVSGSNLFAGTIGGLFRSIDSGGNWTASGTGLTSDDVTSLWANGSILFAGTGMGIFRSTNNGANWDAVDLNIKYAWTFVANGPNLFAGTYSDGLFRSTDNGLNWTLASNGLASLKVRSLVAVGNNIFAGTFGGGVFRSADNGASWIASSTGLTNSGTYVRALVVSGSNLFAGTSSGVFHSSDNGANWTNTGLTDQDIQSLVVSGGNLFAGTTFSGVWSRSLSDFSRKDQSISFGAPEDKMFGDPTFILSAISNSSLPVSYTSSNTSVATISGNTVSIVGAGSTTITANQVGNSEYNPATNVQQVLSVNKASLTATAENKTKTYGDDNPLFTISYSGFKWTDNPSVIDIAPSISSIATSTSNTGAYPITLTGGTDNNYMITNLNGTLTILPKDQTITFSTLSDRTIGDAAFVPTATASSSLPVSFESLTPNKITGSGNLVTIEAPGIATIRAKQTGNTNFNAAPNVDRNFCVRPAKPLITLSGVVTESAMLISNSSTGNQWFFNNNSISRAINPTLMVTDSGIYTVRATIEGCASELSDGLTVVITGDIALRDEQMTAYPNPIQDRLYISLKGFTKGYEVQVKIVDSNGKVLYHKEGRGEELLELSVVGFASGVYFINAEQAQINGLKF
jgi:photosystem II stability/assembly factor-like uncharacterized protein